MPSHYAHYRFGTRCISLLPPKAKRIVTQFRQLYDVGLHGPDIFFYHNIFLQDKASLLAQSTHRESGADFFTRVCKHLRLEPSEAAIAYLYGLLTHFCLDATVHPLVTAQTEDGTIGHAELETEFDRFLLQRDGKRQPNVFDCSPHIRLTPGECVTVAAFYGPATAGMVRASVRGMAASVKLLAMPNGSARRFVEQAAGARLRQHFMGRTPNLHCAHLNEALLERYDMALEAFCGLVQALEAHLSHNAPLEGLFESTFNG